MNVLLRNRLEVKADLTLSIKEAALGACRTIYHLWLCLYLCALQQQFGLHGSQEMCTSDRWEYVKAHLIAIRRP